MLKSKQRRCREPRRVLQNQALADCQERFARAKQLYLAIEIDAAEYQARMASYRRESEQVWAAEYVKVCASQLIVAFCSGKPNPLIEKSDPGQTILAHLYPEPAQTALPFNYSLRNQQLCQRHADGETLEELARVFGITPQRVHQIIRNRRK